MNGEEWNGELNEYNNDGITIFVGRYLNGKKRGIEYDDDHNLIFQGEYIKEKIYIYEKDKYSVNWKMWNGIHKTYIPFKKLLSEEEYFFGRVWNIKIYDEKNKKFYFYMKK